MFNDPKPEIPYMVLDFRSDFLKIIQQKRPDKIAKEA